MNKEQGPHPRYSGGMATCVKCGNRGATTTYVIPTHDGADDDCLLRTCDRCGYGWFEECVDRTPVEPAIPSQTRRVRLICRHCARDLYNVRLGQPLVCDACLDLHGA